MNEAVQERVLKTLDEVGIFVDNTEEDNDLTNYIEDSIQFMSFVVKLEEEFEIEFPNELLIFDNFKTLDSIENMIQQLVVG